MENLKQIIRSLSSLTKDELLALAAALLKEFYLPQWKEQHKSIIKLLKESK